MFSSLAMGCFGASETIFSQKWEVVKFDVRDLPEILEKEERARCQ
jgi:hypothetical protein